MRLESMRQAHSVPQKIAFTLMKLITGTVPPPVRAFSYGHGFFGEAYSACLQDAMRGPSAWTVGERELFAAFVSKVNHCAY
jgi:hypothetical protein